MSSSKISRQKQNRHSQTWRRAYAGLVYIEAKVSPWVAPLSLAIGLGGATVSEQPAEAPALRYELGSQNYADEIKRASEANGIPDGILYRLIKTESDFNPYAENSESGAYGISQFMPDTAKEKGVDPHDPHASIAAAAVYLRELYDHFGSWDQAIEAYNWGPGNVDRWIAKGEDPEAMPLETKNYVARVNPSQS